MEQAQVVELARLRVLVQAAVLELAQVQAQRLAQALTVVSMRVAVLEPQLEREPPVVLARELALAWELELARAAAPEPRQVRKLRVSRQQEL